jgi:hypothetical protein
MLSLTSFLERKIFVVTPALIGELRVARFTDGGMVLEEKIGMVSLGEVAIFDDVAKEKVSEWVQISIFELWMAGPGVGCRRYSPATTILTR